MTRTFWAGRRVFLTGHTGFKGAWMSLWLARAGAHITGYALEPPTHPSLYESADVDGDVTSVIADIRDLDRLAAAVRKAEPEIVIHMAAQPLVRESYADPVATYAVNLMGTVHVLEAIRTTQSIRAAVIVTTDKVYRNEEWTWGYRETDVLGGRDPYANSKACCELAVASYRDSFFSADSRVALASARAGNVIGGGDWAKDRILRDVVAAFAAGKPVPLRYPDATRPWQHVLDPIAGYLTLAEHLFEGGAAFAQAFNFGPPAENVRTVRALVEQVRAVWGGGTWEPMAGTHPHEAGLLALDSSLARSKLGWRPRLDFDDTVAWAVEWYRAFAEGHGRARDLTLSQIEAYEELLKS